MTINSQKLPANKVQDNFQSNRHDGLLIDINNFEQLLATEKGLILKTHYSGDIFVSYDICQEAEEDMMTYKSFLKNPEVKVINVRTDGRLQMFSKNSSEYMELKMGFNCAGS